MRLPLKHTFVSSGLNNWFCLREGVTELKFSQRGKSSETISHKNDDSKEHSKTKHNNFTPIASLNKKWKQGKANGFLKVYIISHFFPIKEIHKQPLRKTNFFCSKNYNGLCNIIWDVLSEGLQANIQIAWGILSLPQSIFAKDKIRLPVWIITWKFCWWGKLSLYKTKCAFSSIDLFQGHQGDGCI